MKTLARLYWRQIAMGVLTVLPPMALMIVGLVWILHSDWVYPSLFAMTMAGFAVAWLGHSIRGKNKKLEAAMQPVDSPWAPTEVQAWQRVQTLATEVQSCPPQTLSEVQELADRVVQMVAKQLHGESDFAWARFTLPEILHAVQQASENLRESVRTRVPGAESITVADVMVIRNFYLRHESKLKVAYSLWRIKRFLVAPQVALYQELKGYATGKGFDSGSSIMRGWMARLLTEELGRSAINLYSGRFRLTSAEANQSLIESAPPPVAPVPIRILIAGQINAGKSSLTNALLGSVKSPVSELPTPGGVREFRIDPKGGLNLVVLDTPGLTSVGGNKQLLLHACANADLMVWVAQANNPARAVDVAVLAEIRLWFKSRPQIKPPPMVLAVTHIDKLSPSKEWSPPYDIVGASSPKANNIRQALEQVSQTLGFGETPAIPLALRPEHDPYNLEALWATIAVTLNNAQLTALDRELKQGAGFNLSKTFDQCRQGGRFLISKMWADHFGKNVDSNG